jgi:predicted secreted protein
MIKQIVLQTEWATNQRIYQISASMNIGYPTRDGKTYTQADIDQARAEIKESEDRLNAALEEGYTLFASIPLKDSIGVNLILYKADA